MNKIHHHNVRDPWPFPDKYFHTICTSPPYYGLRDYGVSGQVGLEETPEEFIYGLVLIFREAWRVLRDDGTLWINIGDSYWGGKGKSGCQSPEKAEARNHDGKAMTKKWQQLGGYDQIRPTDKKHSSIKAKDMIGIPWMLAFALRADGWYLRQDIIWNKPNPMPESINDRCTKSHEYIFLLSKSKKYFYDNHAIKEPASYSTHARVAKARTGNKSEPDQFKNGIRPRKLAAAGSGTKNNGSFDAAMVNMPDTRNKRSVWTINPQSFSEAHFATFPVRLPMECIKAGTSEHGCCNECGAPYRRIVQPSAQYASILGEGYHDHSQDLARGNTQNRGRNHQHKMREAGLFSAEYITVGWSASCKCVGGGSVVPCRVLDPFMGAGTTALAARSLGRNYAGLELNPKYIKIADARLIKELGLFI